MGVVPIFSEYPPRLSNNAFNLLANCESINVTSLGAILYVATPKSSPRAPRLHPN